MTSNGSCYCQAWRLNHAEDLDLASRGLHLGQLVDVEKLRRLEENYFIRKRGMEFLQLGTGAEFNATVFEPTRLLVEVEASTRLSSWTDPSLALASWESP